MSIWSNLSKKSTEEPTKSIRLLLMRKGYGFKNFANKVVRFDYPRVLYNFTIGSSFFT